jgi:hypothetical protein
VASSDPTWRERYWLSVADVKRRDFVLSLGFGKYPNNDVMEGSCMATYKRVQYNLRASRQLMPKTHEIAVGPMSVQIIEPLKTLRFRLDDNESEMKYDITWHGVVEPALEARHFEVNRARVTHDISRYVQTGRMTGWIDIPGMHFDLDRENWWAVRDHSWGIRPMTSQPGAPPVANVEWNLLVFFPIQFPDFSLHIYLFEAQPGRATHLTAAIMRPFGAQEHDDDIKSIEHEFEWVTGAPIATLKGGKLLIHFFNGRTLNIALIGHEGRVYLRGGGWGTTMGLWRGVNSLEYDRWDLSNTEKLREYVLHSSDHLAEARCDGQVGYGIIEYMVRRGYGKYQEVHRKKNSSLGAS